MNTQTKTKTVSFEKVLTDLKRFTATKQNARPVLKCAYYDGKYLKATDSIKAIRINSEYVDQLPSKDNFLYDVYEKETTDKYNFPQLDRLFPDMFISEVSITDNQLKELRKGLEVIYQNTKDNDNKMMKIKVSNNNLIIESSNKETNEHKSYLLGNVLHTGEDIEMYFNASNFKKALLTCSKLNKLSNNETKMKFTGKLRPITITNDQVYDILMLPIRVY